MSIVPSESANEQEISNSISRFVCDFKIGSLLKRCNCKKQKGVPIMRLFTYILCSVFRDRSMHMQKKTGNFKEDFSKNAYYRFFAVPIPTGCVLLRYSLKRSSMSICVDLLLMIELTALLSMTIFTSGLVINIPNWPPKYLIMSV